MRITVIPEQLRQVARAFREAQSSWEEMGRRLRAWQSALDWEIRRQQVIEEQIGQALYLARALAEGAGERAARLEDAAARFEAADREAYQAPGVSLGRLSLPPIPRILGVWTTGSPARAFPIARLIPGIVPPLGGLGMLTLSETLRQSLGDLAERVWNWIHGYGWRTNAELAVSSQSSIPKGEPAMTAQAVPPEDPHFKRFKRALDFVLRVEGDECVDNPKDPGRRTKWGITQGTYNYYLVEIKKLLMCRDVCQITKEEVEEIYYDMYWKASSADRLPEPLDLVHFDAAVNHGVGGACEILIKVLGEAQQRAGSKNPCKILDKVLDEAQQRAGFENPVDLSRAYLEVRTNEWYLEILKDPSKDDFREGWRNRLVQLAEEIGLNPDELQFLQQKYWEQEIMKRRTKRRGTK